VGVCGAGRDHAEPLWRFGSDRVVSGNSGHQPHAVGHEQGNAYGLYDMLTVGQWMADWFWQLYG
jgi:formylglycine-generating enzyme required for sulfatase activity